MNKGKVYTALNAEELKSGDYVVCANTMYELEHKVNECCASVLCCVMSDREERRFCIKHATIGTTYALAYLIEKH